MVNSPTILVIDNEAAIRRLLRAALERAHYQVIEARTHAQALEIVEQEAFDAVLLDLSLPDRDGLQLIPAILKHPHVVVLVVSARDTTNDKVSALDLGAADYLTKPFDTEELLARLRASLRRQVISKGGQPVVLIDGLTIDVVERRITRQGCEIHFTPKEFSVVAELAHFPGRIITHQQLLGAIWPNNYQRHRQYLRILIRNVRMKIENDPTQPRLILNAPGVGYRLARPLAES